MLGAIAGDIIGSPYEWQHIKTIDFPLFSERSRYTDDTVMTVAVASALLDGADYARALRSFALQYPHAGYGRGFKAWFTTAGAGPYHSWGNGSAMRVSPVGFACKTMEDVLDEARRSAEITHNHPEGVKGAQATAAAVFLARSGRSKEDIRSDIEERFGYDLARSIEDIRPGYRFDVSCQGSVPEAIIAYLESTDFEGAVRNAVSLGGDSDTLACIAGGIAQVHYGGIPSWIVEETRSRLPAQFLDIIDRFEAEYALEGMDCRRRRSDCPDDHAATRNPGPNKLRIQSGQHLCSANPAARRVLVGQCGIGYNDWDVIV